AADRRSWLFDGPDDTGDRNSDALRAARRVVLSGRPPGVSRQRAVSAVARADRPALRHPSAGRALRGRLVSGLLPDREVQVYRPRPAGRPDVDRAGDEDGGPSLARLDADRRPGERWFELDEAGPVALGQAAAVRLRRPSRLGPHGDVSAIGRQE